MGRVFVVFLMLLSFVSCDKKIVAGGDGYEYVSGTGIKGKWLAKERFISSGGSPYWVTMSRDQWFLVEFREDSGFVYTDKFPKADSFFNRYRLDSNFMLMSSTSNANTARWMYDLLPDGR